MVIMEKKLNYYNTVGYVLGFDTGLYRDNGKEMETAI